MMFAWLFSDPLPVGTPAPDFSLPDDSGGVVRLSAWRGADVVLVFYPGDDTPLHQTTLPVPRPLE